MIMLIGIIAAIVIAVVMIRYVLKNEVGLDVESAITLHPGETLITSITVSGKHKMFYLSRYSIPMGTLDITDQRLVFTPTTETAEFFKSGMSQESTQNMESGCAFVKAQPFFYGQNWIVRVLELEVESLF